MSSGIFEKLRQQRGPVSPEPVDQESVDRVARAALAEIFPAASDEVLGIAVQLLRARGCLTVELNDIPM